MRRILFSALGMTDPISEMRDAALLHIIRKYRPDKVYVYMSKEVCDLEDKDRRYSYCIEKLKEFLKLDTEVEYIRDEGLVDVHIFDTLLDKFTRKLTLTYEDNCEMLVNVSSGTPAMKSALQVLAAMYERPLKAIQVSTPQKSMNIRTDVKNKYSVKDEWDCNLDNEDYIDRCTESAVVNIIVESKIRIIRDLIDSYDYPAAYTLAKEVEEFISQDSINLIMAGASRLKLDKSTCSKICNSVGFDIYPVKNSSYWSAFEYLVLMKIKLHKEEYADFVRMISPIYMECMKRIIEASGQVDLKQYTYTTKTNVVKWNKTETAKRPEIFEKVNGFRNTDSVISTADFYNLISVLDFSSDVKKAVENIRNVESSIRNTAAHSIVQVTEEDIKRKTGYTPKQIFDMLKKLMQYANINISKEALDTYDDLNKEIVNRLRTV